MTNMNTPQFVKSFESMDSKHQAECVSLMLFYLTIQARDSYARDEQSIAAELRKFNEVQHVLSGYLTDLLLVGSSKRPAAALWEVVSSMTASLSNFSLEKSFDWIS